MKNKMCLLAVALLLMFSWNVGADTSASREAMQQSEEQVSGVVVDEYGPVAGAAIRVKDLLVGTITDADGKFFIGLSEGAVLVVSFLGYQDREVVWHGEDNLTIKLEPDSELLDEVQVVAYGTVKKVTVTGAISSMNSSDVMKTPTGSITNALSGKISGLASVQSKGQPGEDDATLYVRGVGSLSTDLSSPLVLVDGVERSFSQLDPNEIADITVLKDASATAVFGVRGANGVILVTTKRGEEGKVKINVSTSYAVQIPTRIPEFADSYDYAVTYNQAALESGTPEADLPFTTAMIEGYRTHSSPYVYPDVDWADLMLRKAALQTQHNFTMSGGTKTVRYFVSLGAYTQEGLYRVYETDYNSNYRYNRYNYRINLDVDITKSTLMKINLGGRLSNQRTPNYNNATSTDLGKFFQEIYNTVPFISAGIVDGKYVKVDSRLLPSSFNTTDPLQNIYGRGYRVALGNTLNFDFILEQKLDFITKGLNLSLKASYNSGVTQTKTREGWGDMYEAGIDSENNVYLSKTQEKTTLSYSESYGLSRDWYVEAALNYARDFGHHHVSALAMYNQSMKYYPAGTYQGIPRAYVGFVGRVTYDYDTRYMADFSVGYNGSENFAPGQRFGLFPAGSIGWIITEEKFMEPLKPWLSYLKLRASYGIVGNDNTGDNARFLYLPDSWTITGDGKGYSFGTGNSSNVPVAAESKIGNPNVTWETAAKQNYGVDLQLFDHRLKASFDYFIEHRRNILISQKTRPSYLAMQLPTMNLGKVDNKGYEISVKWEDRVKDFSYYVGVNLSYAKNTIVFQDEIPQEYDWMMATGKPVGTYFGYQADGFFTEEEAARYETEKGKTMPDYGDGMSFKAGDVKYKDLNGDMKIDYRDKSAIGYPIYPLFTGGLNLGFTYRGFDLSMTWTAATKTSRMLEQIWRIPFGEMNTQSLLQYHIDNQWTPEKGDASKEPRISFENKRHNYEDSDLWLRDASYLRLKNMEIGYSLPANVIKKMKLSQFRIYVSGFNLLTFDKLKILDPEQTNTYSGDYPLVKVVNFGLKLGF